MNQSLFDPKPVVLTGIQIQLEPLSLHHAQDLFEAGNDDRIWRYLPIPRPHELEQTLAWIQSAIHECETGNAIPFAIVKKSSQKAIGSTRYFDIRRNDRALEIGWTWLGEDYQRTGINPECKFLLLRHAFEDLGAERVQFKTDGRNLRSQKAMERLGFVKEGILRRSRLCWDGVYRDTVYYSVLREEWGTLDTEYFSELLVLIKTRRE